MSEAFKFAVDASAIEIAPVTVRLPKEMHASIQLMAEHVAAWMARAEDVRSFALGVCIRMREAEGRRIGCGLTVSNALFADKPELEIGLNESQQFLLEAERMASIGGLCAGAEARGERAANDIADYLVDEFHANDRPLEQERAKQATARALHAAYMASFNETRACAKIMTMNPARYASGSNPPPTTGDQH